MPNLKSLYDSDLISEDESEEINIYGISTKIILELLSKPCSEKMLCYNTGISMRIIQLNLNRLEKRDIVEVKDRIIVDGKLEKIYQLKSTDIELLTNKVGGDNAKNLFSTMLAANNLSNITKSIVKNISEDPNKPSSVKAVFIKVNSKRVAELKKEIEKVMLKFESMEDLEEDEVYGFINILGPYK